FGNTHPLGRERDVWRDQDCLDLLLCKVLKGTLQVVRNAVIKMHEGERRLGRRSLGLSPLRYVQRVLDIDESADARKMGEQFADNIDLLGRQVLGEVREPGDVAAGTR